MKTKEQFLEEIKKIIGGVTEEMSQQLFLEVLIDIRDLLSSLTPHENNN